MRKGLLLTCLLTLVAAFGMAQTATWPITLTAADGLPGVKGPMNYTFKSPVYQFDEAIQTLRMTVVGTKQSMSNTNAYNGYSSGWGPGLPYFNLGEVNIYDADGNKIEYTAETNALSTWDGKEIAALNDGNFGSYVSTTWYSGPCPQDYHYIDFTFNSAPLSALSIEWLTRSGNTDQMPMHVGLTPGTRYGAYPEQEFRLGEQVTTLEEIAEGGLFVIRDNAEEWMSNAAPDRGSATLNKAFLQAPCGGLTEADASTVVYFTPTGEENTYKIGWLNSGKFITFATSSWTGWSDNEAEAANIKFNLGTDYQTSKDFTGTFVLTASNDEVIYYMDNLGKMAQREFTKEIDSLTLSRGGAYNFSIYKASINSTKVKEVLAAKIKEVEEYISLYGYNEIEDEGEYEKVTASLEAAKKVYDDAEAAPAAILAAGNDLNSVLPPYIALSIYVYTDSIGVLIDGFDDGTFQTSSGADGWVMGSFPEDSKEILQAALDAALLVADTWTTLDDVNNGVADALNAIDEFWASQINDLITLPYLVNSSLPGHAGLPGTAQDYGGYVWESPLYKFAEPIEGFRFTVFDTNNHAEYSSGIKFATWGEFEIYDEYGNKIELSESDFKTNGVVNSDGIGLAGLCDGDATTWYHSPWGSGQDAEYDANPAHIYLEVTLPEPMNSFRYKQYGRSNAANTPIEWAFSNIGEDVTPNTLIPDPYNTAVGEQITDASQITDDGFYALVGLINCAPEGDGSGFEKFYSSNVPYGRKISAPAVYSIRKTDEEGAFYIQSLVDARYWSNKIDDDGWESNNIPLTADEADAGKYFIKPMPRAEFGYDTSFENTFVIYQYNDTVKRVASNTDVFGTEPVAHPYIVVQDYGTKSGYFSCPTLEYNDWDGEGEWKIFKVTMDNPYIYWLSSVVASAESLGLVQSNDPGYYKDLGNFSTTFAAAQAALAANDEAAAKNAIPALRAAMKDTEGLVSNPVVEGVYVIEAGYDEYFKQQGVKKVLFTYYNDFSDTNADGDFKLYWGDAPEGDYKESAKLYQFELISAAAAEQVAVWLEDSAITAEQAKDAYYIKSVEFNCYIGASDDRSKQFSSTANPEQIYIVRSQGAGNFDLWNPTNSEFSIHQGGHNNGAGVSGTIVYWTGNTPASHWKLRTISTKTSISDIVVEGDEVVSVAYYTAAGAQVPAPVKGINIVKTVYANGVVKSEKVYIK